ncbi:MAG: DNA cytosine methyltransferase [Nitrososphaera sp.]|nr:DNA cytosine methyltransferase [Nitrososphaera sp.]
MNPLALHEQERLTALEKTIAAGPLPSQLLGGQRRIPLLSFFSGGGFLDLGFEEAGFDVVWSNEVQESFADMYRAGISSWRQAAERESSNVPFVNQDSIEKLSKREIMSEAFGSVGPDFFGIIGGPPCQDYSISGKGLGSKGDNGKLTRFFVDSVCDLRPGFFLMENVPGLYNRKHRAFYKEMVAKFNDGHMGYLTSMRILNALEYGVPQDRRRLFLVGFRKDTIPDEYLFSTPGEQTRDWFPWPHPPFFNAKNLPWPTTSPFGCKTLPVPAVPLELTIGRLVGDEAEQLPNGQESFTPYSNKFNLVEEGDVSGKSFRRLHRYRFSPTACYGHSEVYLHPWKPRRLTVREALRIQSVPDEYILPPENTLTDKFKIISNGVPTLLARYIASALLKYITDKNIEVSNRVRDYPAKAFA